MSSISIFLQKTLFASATTGYLTWEFQAAIQNYDVVQLQRYLDSGQRMSQKSIEASTRLRRLFADKFGDFPGIVRVQHGDFDDWFQF